MRHRFSARRRATSTDSSSRTHPRTSRDDTWVATLVSTSLLRELVTQLRHRLTGVSTVALAAVSLVALASCDGSTSTAQPLPSASSSSSSPITTTSATPSATPTGWQSKYTPEQITEYEQALGRWEDYERESAPLWADPKPSDSTLGLFRSYFYNEDLLQGRLDQYARADVRIQGLPEVLWSKPLAVDGQSVTIQQCIDATAVQVTQRGQVVPGNAQPILREIDLSVPAGQADYLIQRIHDPSWGRKVQTCSAE